MTTSAASRSRADDFALLNPNTRTCPIFRSRRDAELTKAIYRRVPVLVREGDPDGNHGASRSCRPVPHGERLAPVPRASSGDRARVPLYEAKMIHHFDHRFGDYEGQTRRRQHKDELPELTDDSHDDPGFVIAPRYWVDEREVEARLAGRWDRDWLLGWRDITERATVPDGHRCAIPRVGVGHSMPSLPSTEPRATRHALAAQSSTLRVRLRGPPEGRRHHISRSSSSKQLPVLHPSDYRATAPWVAGARARDWLAPRVLELVYTAWDIEPFARDHGYDGPPFRWDPERRALLRAELDAAFFHLYGLERDDVDYVMDTFSVVRDRDVKAHGEYRTKRLILEIYDELAEAIATGRPYQTRLDPPPADPRVAHPHRIGHAAVTAEG